MMSKNILAIFGVLVLLSLASCKPAFVKAYKKQLVKDPIEQAQKDENAILQYLIEQELDYERTSSGIYYKIDSLGDAMFYPDETVDVTAHYKGTLLNGAKFDSSFDRDKPLEFKIGNMIQGWQEIIPMLKKGGKGTFIIPSHLAYGDQARGEDIPANSNLIFYIHLIDYNSKSMQAKIDEQLIQDYLTENSIDAQRTSSGIYYTIEKEGSNKHPHLDCTVKTHYKGQLLDGKQFDSSYDRGEPISFPLKGVIQGWQEAIPLLGEGGKGRFFIPSGLAYGPRPVGNGLIPANSVLIFDVELLDFTDPATQAEDEAKAIADYIQDNNLTDYQKTDSGIYYKIEKEGTGKQATPASTVTVHYEGSLLNGKVFDSSYKRGETISFPLNRVIEGWQEGIPLLKEGGKGTFIIPSNLGYGERGAGADIPPFSTLIFKVELFEVK